MNITPADYARHLQEVARSGVGWRVGLQIARLHAKDLAASSRLDVATDSGDNPSRDAPQRQLAWRRMYSSKASRLTSATRRPWAAAISSRAVRVFAETRTVRLGVCSRPPLSEGRPR